MHDTQDTRVDRRRILIADDNAAIRSLLRLFLEGLGYEVETADNGVQAMTCFAGGRFHLVMTNYRMPGMNGLEVASAIRRRDPEVPIVLMTGMTHALSAMEVARAGVTKLFSKPFGLNEICAWLRSLPNAITPCPPHAT